MPKCENKNDRLKELRINKSTLKKIDLTGKLLVLIACDRNLNVNTFSFHYRITTSQKLEQLLTTKTRLILRPLTKHQRQLKKLRINLSSSTEYTKIRSDVVTNWTHIQA